MGMVCTSCGKSVSTAGGAQFCSFCGSKLHDPDRTGDMPTRSFTGTVGHPDELPSGAPEVIGSYRLGRRLGSGGMGTVFEAESDSGDRVAIKLLAARLSASPISVERFRQEGRLASQISHPRCVFVVAADTDAGRPFIVMELMPGTTLKDIVDQRGKLPVGEAVARILDVVDGLAEAHRLGVIHRDVKPSNCFLTSDDRVKVGDFGLSKTLGNSGPDKQLTNTGAFLGTVLFASPEQIRGDDVGYDSDVYSTAATLFYTLTGRAPYHHENLTAALAKAVSEPPPSARAMNPAVPRGLDRVVRRGLDRDRTRRYATLDEFREALAEHLPGQRQPARPRSLIAAYLIDLLLLGFLVQLPVQLLEGLLAGWEWLQSMNAMGFDPGVQLGTILYFTLLEGLTGATLGKWLLNLRVSRPGTIGPPGLRGAFIRSLVFSGLWLVTISVPLAIDDIPFIGWPLAAACAALGLIATVQQLRPSRNYLGIHDQLAKTCVTVKPRPPHRMKLSPPSPGPFEKAAPISDAPTTVGGYTVRGQLSELPGGAAVWAAEDPVLNRKILLWIRPGTDHPPPPNRSARLRTVGAGELLYRNQACEWVAFAAPAGGPLVDSVSPEKPLPWDDSRLLLEQLAEELKAGESDGTLPTRLGVDQLWAEPAGRLHLLDFPLPTTANVPPAVVAPIELLRQTAALTLEGAARTLDQPIRAPLPPHAKQVTDSLADGRLADLGAFAAAVAETHSQPARVTGPMRLAHAGLTGMLAGTALIVMFALCLLVQFIAAAGALQQRSNAAAVRAGLNDPAIRETWTQSDRLAEFRDPAAVDRADAQLRGAIQMWDRVIEKAQPGLTRPERFLLSEMREFTEELPKSNAVRTLPTLTVRQVIDQANMLAQKDDAAVNVGKGVYFVSATSVAVCVAGFIAFAVVFRGGLSYWLAGLTLVRADGRLAERWRCGLRELFVWLPLVALLAFAALLQIVYPQDKLLRLFVAILCFGLLLGWVIVAVRLPGRGPHDRLAGTFVVPV
jgi:eukaryotic-like serine/threonine-protein kinase